VPQPPPEMSAASIPSGGSIDSLSLLDSLRRPHRPSRPSSKEPVHALKPSPRLRMPPVSPFTAQSPHRPAALASNGPARCSQATAHWSHAEAATASGPPGCLAAQRRQPMPRGSQAACLAGHRVRSRQTGPRLRRHCGRGGPGPHRRTAHPALVKSRIARLASCWPAGRLAGRMRRRPAG
jgi:hypothetical protein